MRQGTSTGLRSRTILVLLVALVSIVAANVNGAAASSAGQLPSSSDTVPLTRFGFSDGKGGDQIIPPAQQNQTLAAMQSVIPSDGYVRSEIHWNPYTMAEPSWTRYDAYLGRVLAHHLTWIPLIVPAIQNQRVAPQAAPGGLAAWSAAVKQIVAHYGPGGIYASTHPGFPGLTSYVIWEEPDAPSGCAIANPGNVCQMKPQILDQILTSASTAIRSQATAMGFQPEIIGGALASVDIQYLDQLYSVDPNVLGSIDTVSVHIYPSVSPATCSTTSWPAAANCMRTLAVLRAWLDAHAAGGTGPAIAVDEAGYSGSNAPCRPPNVFDETTQANLNSLALNWIRAHPELRVTLFANFAPVDQTSVTYTCGKGANSAYFMQHVGVMHADGVTLKPWGVAYRNIVLDAKTDPLPSAPSPTVDQASMSFPAQVLTVPSKSQTVTLTNAGTAALPVTGVALSGGATRSFSVTNGCPASLPPAASCAITVVFDPVAMGPVTTTLDIAVNAVPSILPVGLSGTGVQGHLTFSPTSLAFPTQSSPYRASALKTTSVTNTGNAPVTIANIILKGAAVPQFTWSTDCPAVIAVGATCAVTAQFTPTSRGTKTGIIRFTDDGQTGGQSLTLTGTAN